MENNITIHNVEQGSEAWHELRCGRITASKFKDLMAGLSTAGYTKLINACVGEILSETTEPTYTNDIMQRGIDLEPEARKFYEALYDTHVEEVGFITNEDLFPEYIGVSPDGTTEDGGLIEIKCPLIHTHIDYLLKGSLPSVYKWQVQGQLLVTGATYCDFMSYYPNIRPLVYRVLPDEELQEELRQRMSDTIVSIKQKLETINTQL